MPLPKQKLLFVDDRTKRINYALRAYGEFEVTIATCVPEALRLLCSQEWDLISLDHDLNGHDFQDPDDPTSGMEIPRYIFKCGGWPFGKKKPQVRIHSSNIFAAELMKDAFRGMDFSVVAIPIIYDEE